MKKIKQRRIVVIAAVCTALVVGGFYYVTKQRSASVEDMVELTEVQSIITKNLEKNYPATPREVVKLYNRIIACYYNETYTDEELYQLGDQIRMLFDPELLENNPRDAYFTELKAEIEDYHEKSKTITSSNVCSSNEVNYQIVDGDECAYVNASYFINENKNFSRTYQTYVLRKDEDGDWKILVFYRVEGDSSDE